MSWIGERVRDVYVQDAYLQVQDSAEWSEWLPFSSGVTSAPRLPGVYLFRETGSQMIRYAGMAGERAGGGRPQGLHGRLNFYRTGKVAKHQDRADRKPTGTPPQAATRHFLAGRRQTRRRFAVA